MYEEFSMKKEMSKKKQGQIALIYLKLLVRRKGMRLGPKVNENIIATAPQLGISPKDALEFVAIMAREVVTK
jgi:hypothetical protein